MRRRRDSAPRRASAWDSPPRGDAASERASAPPLPTGRTAVALRRRCRRCRPRRHQPRRAERPAPRWSRRGGARSTAPPGRPTPPPPCARSARTTRRRIAHTKTHPRTTAHRLIPLRCPPKTALIRHATPPPVPYRRRRRRRLPSPPLPHCRRLPSPPPPLAAASPHRRLPHLATLTSATLTASAPLCRRRRRPSRRSRRACGCRQTGISCRGGWCDCGGSASLHARPLCA